MTLCFELASLKHWWVWLQGVHRRPCRSI